MAEVVVIGAGLGGLATALFCALRGHTVILLERDDPPKPHATAEEDFLYWERSGVPHARQGHTFLALSTRVLRREAPDVVDAIVDRGAGRASIDEEGEDENLLSRRLVYEGVLRRAVEAEPAVTVLSAVGVDALRIVGDWAGVPHVTGVRTIGGDEIAADLVIDASGRRSHAPRWLVDAGGRPPVETAQSCGFFYLTQHYRLREGCAFPTARVPILAKLDYTKVVVFPGDNGCFQLSTTVVADDPLRRRLQEARVYQRFLEEVPLTAPWVECGEPIDEPRPMARLEDRWRRLVDEQGPVVAGFVLLADAAMQTNPAFGRGVSLALLHAQHLAETVETARADPLGYVARFEDWTKQHMGVWFDAQTASTREQLQQLRAGVHGDPIPPPSDTITRFVAALSVMSKDDAQVCKIQARFLNMLMTPQELMADRVAGRRIWEFLRTHPELVAHQSEPDRATFEHLVAG